MEQRNRERADALLGCHDAIQREQEAAEGASTDRLVAQLPEVRELMEGRRDLKNRRDLCAKMGLKISVFQQGDPDA